MSPHKRTEDDFQREVEAHLAIEADRLREDGVNPSEAADAARRRFGNLTQVREARYESRRGLWLERIRQDVRFAVRSLARNPVLAAAVIASLALGIGATSAIFSTLYAVLLRPLPYADPDRIVTVWEEWSAGGFPTNTPAPANYHDWLARNTVFDEIAASLPTRGNLTGDGAPEQLMGRRVTANFFTIFGVPPMLGRTFTAEEDRQQAPVVVISETVWRRRYLEDSGIVGRTITLNDAPVTVVGVMPQSFVFRDREIEYWAPISFTPQQAALRTVHVLNVVARLRPGVSLDAARAQMSTVADDLEREYPENRDVGVALVPIREEVFGDVEQQFMLLAVAAGCLLLMMCANMANVLFARAIARRHEVVTRAALGADRSRLLSQMTVEGLVWTTAGSVGGVLVAWGGLRVLAALVPVTLAETATPRLDLRLFAIALTLGVVMGVACALAPAFTGTRTPLSQALRHATTATPGRSARARSALMTVQVATACVLLIGAALMIQSLMNVRAIDLGFRPSGLLTLRTTLPASRYDSQARIAFYDRVIEQVQQLPGVRGAGFVSTLPFTSRGNTGGFRLEGRPPDLNDTALFRIGTADYLRTLGVELREGRLPDSRDAAGTPRVAIITTAFARRYWPNTSAIGQRIALNNPDAAWMTVIGVVGDVYETGYEFDGRPGFYVLASQIPANADNLVVRSDGDPLSLVPAVQRVIAGIDPLQPVSAVRAMDDIITLSIIDRRQQSIVLGVFAAAAVLLAAIGLYGLIAFLVGQRGREVGIRLALGATPLSIARTVSREAVVITTLGLALGAGLALAGGRLLQDLLYGVPANDARTFAAVLLTLTAVAAIACAVPVRRSIRSGARIVLRQE